MAVVGVVLILAVLLIGSGVLIWHRNKVFTDKPVSVSEPPPKLPWKPWDVVLRVCWGLCWIAAWVFKDDVPGLPPDEHRYTVAGFAYSLIAFVPFIVTGTVIGVRDRRRKAELTRRETNAGEQWTKD